MNDEMHNKMTEAESPDDAILSARLRADVSEYRRSAPPRVVQQIMRDIQHVAETRHSVRADVQNLLLRARLAAAIVICAAIAGAMLLSANDNVGLRDQIAGTHSAATLGARPAAIQRAPNGASLHRSGWETWLASAGMSLERADLDRVAAGVSQASIDTETRAILADFSSAWDAITTRSQALLKLKPHRISDV